MNYNFTDVIERNGKDAIAAEVIPYADIQVKEGFSRLPMWVADMNFATAPSIPGNQLTHRVSSWQVIREISGHS